MSTPCNKDVWQMRTTPCPPLRRLLDGACTLTFSQLFIFANHSAAFHACRLPAGSTKDDISTIVTKHPDTTFLWNAHTKFSKSVFQRPNPTEPWLPASLTRLHVKLLTASQHLAWRLTALVAHEPCGLPITPTCVAAVLDSGWRRRCGSHALTATMWCDRRVIMWQHDHHVCASAASIYCISVKNNIAMRMLCTVGSTLQIDCAVLPAPLAPLHPASTSDHHQRHWQCAERASYIRCSALHDLIVVTCVAAAHSAHVS
jgi:hypothetical protein